jgi:hypothetical protein
MAPQKLEVSVGGAVERGSLPRDKLWWGAGLRLEIPVERSEPEN